MSEEPKRFVEILHHDVLKGRTQPTDQEGPYIVERLPLTFFVRVFWLSVPFWCLDSATALQLMPGRTGPDISVCQQKDASAQTGHGGEAYK